MSAIQLLDDVTSNRVSSNRRERLPLLQRISPRLAALWQAWRNSLRIWSCTFVTVFPFRSRTLDIYKSIYFIPEIKMLQDIIKNAINNQKVIISLAAKLLLWEDWLKLYAGFQ
jgi:hypothetical protein